MPHLVPLVTFIDSFQSSCSQLTQWRGTSNMTPSTSFVLGQVGVQRAAGLHFHRKSTMYFGILLMQRRLARIVTLLSQCNPMCRTRCGLRPSEPPFPLKDYRFDVILIEARSAKGSSWAKKTQKQPLATNQAKSRKNKRSWSQCQDEKGSAHLRPCQ